MNLSEIINARPEILAVNTRIMMGINTESTARRQEATKADRCPKCGAGDNCRVVEYSHHLITSTCKICGKVEYVHLPEKAEGRLKGDGESTRRRQEPEVKTSGKKRMHNRILSRSGLCICGCGRPIRTKFSAYAKECSDSRKRIKQRQYAKELKQRFEEQLRKIRKEAGR